MTYKVARRVAIGIVGVTVVILGVIMLVTPGPGLVVVPVGLAILSLEFAWARVWLGRLRRVISSNGASARARRAERYRQRVTS